MKNKKIYIPLLIILLILIGLGIYFFFIKEEEGDIPPEPSKFSIDSEYLTEGKLVEITGTELIELEKDKKSFMVFMYVPGCSSCAAFRVVLEEFLKTNNVTIFVISKDEIKETNLEKPNFSKIVNVKYGPSLILYKKGKLVKYLDSGSDEDKPYFKTVDQLTEWLNKYVILEKGEE